MQSIYPSHNLQKVNLFILLMNIFNDILQRAFLPNLMSTENNQLYKKYDIDFKSK